MDGHQLVPGVGWLLRGASVTRTLNRLHAATGEDRAEILDWLLAEADLALYVLEAQREGGRVGGLGRAKAKRKLRTEWLAAALELKIAANERGERLSALAIARDLVESDSIIDERTGKTPHVDTVRKVIGDTVRTAIGKKYRLKRK